jgi:hypothetical protein
MAWYANSSGQTQYGPTGGTPPPGYTLITTWNGDATSPPPPQAIQIAQQVAAKAPAAQAAAEAAVAPGPNLTTPYATTTLGYGTNPTGAPSITGQGLFEASPYAINDQAITGAPTQGAAQDYGLNDVWNNLSSALAANQVGANGQTAIAGNQGALAATLANQAAGGGVSPADLQLQAGEQQALANNMALLGSQRGGASGNPALAARLAAEGQAGTDAATNQALGIQRAQETLNAQQAEGAVLGQQMSGAQAGQSLANQQGLALLGAQTGVGESQQAAALANQQLQVQQQNAVNQVNEAGFGNAAQANANLLGTITSAGGAGLGLLANMAKGAAGSGGSSSTDTGEGYTPGTVAGQGVQPGQNPDDPGGTSVAPDLGSEPIGDDSLSDENVKTGVAGGNPMMQSFLNQMQADKAAPETVNVTSNYVAPRVISHPQATSAGGTSQDAAAAEQAAGSIPLVGGVISGMIGAAQPWATTSTTPGYTAPASGFQQVNVSPEQMNLGGTTSDEEAKTDIEDLEPDDDDIWSRMASLSPAEVKTDIQPGNSPVSSYLGQVSANSGAATITPKPYYGGGVQPPSSAPGDSGGSQGGGSQGPFQTSGPSGIMPSLGTQPVATSTATAPFTPGNASGPNLGIAGKMTTAPAGGRTSTPGNAIFATGQGQQQGWQLGGQQYGPSGVSAATGDLTAQNSPGSAGAAVNAGASAPVISQIAPGGIKAFANMTPIAKPAAVAVPIAPGPGALGLGGQVTNAVQNSQNTTANLLAKLAAPPAVSNATLAAVNAAPTSVFNALAAARQPALNAAATNQAIANLGTTQGLVRNLPLGISDEEAKKDIADPEPDDVQGFLDSVHAHSYRYKDPNELGAGHGTFVSPMAQEIEKTDLGKNFVFEGPNGHKMVDYGKMSGTLLAAQAMQNERLNDHEKMIRSMMGKRA